MRPSTDGEERRHRQDDDVGQDVGRADPGHFLARRAQIAGHLRQRDVDDGGVEHLHHRRGDEAGEDEPARARDVLLVRLVGRQRAAAAARHRTDTDTVTDMPGRSTSSRVARVVEDDLHRHALHDLDEIAAGVVRRQQAERGAGRRGNAVDVPGIVAAAVRVDRDRRVLARAADRAAASP